jgi:drug/metabolite transporter (DMT)-like permease
LQEGAVANWLSDIYSSSGAFAGETAALTAAILWAAATLMFGKLGQQLTPLMLNLVKGLFAIAFILLTLALRSRFSPDQAPDQAIELPIRSTIYLLISGAVGIGLGDTAYFAAINAIGARRALLLETLAPPMAAALAWIFLGERLGINALGAIVLTLGGIAWVISERVPGSEKPGSATGIKIALLATFCQASGAVLSRAALANTAVDPLLSALLRLVAGLVLLGALALLRNLGKSSLAAEAQPQNPWQDVLAVLKSPKLLVIVALTAFFGTYLGIWLQQIALKYTAAGIAQSLLATSPLFVLPMAAWLGDRVSWRAAGGAIVALSGVWLLYTR